MMHTEDGFIETNNQLVHNYIAYELYAIYSPTALSKIYKIVIKLEFRKIFIVALAALFLLPNISFGQEQEVHTTTQGEALRSTPLFFRQSKSDIELSIDQNMRAIRSIDSITKLIGSHKVAMVELYGIASPEGSTQQNMRINEERIASLERIISEHINLDNYRVSRISGVDWDKFREVVACDRRFAYRDTVLTIIDSNLPMGKDWEGCRMDGRILALRKIDGGEAWRQLKLKHFNELRSAWALFILEADQEPTPEIEIIAEESAAFAESAEDSAAVAESAEESAAVAESTEESDAVAESTEESAAVAESAEFSTVPTVAEPTEPTELTEPTQPIEPIEPIEPTEPTEAQTVATRLSARADEAEEYIDEEPPYFPSLSIKLNAAAAPLMLLNVGVEYNISNRVSIALMGIYSPYNYMDAKRKLRLFAIEPEVRYWWGKPLMRGHFVGIHAPIGGFNVQFNDNYRYQDPNRLAWGVGISYGYLLPLTKNYRWLLEFTAGVGYMNIAYDQFEGVKNGRYLRSDVLNYVGPTHLGINLSCRIGFFKKEKREKLIE